MKNRIQIRYRNKNRPFPPPRLALDVNFIFSWTYFESSLCQYQELSTASYLRKSRIKHFINQLEAKNIHNASIIIDFQRMTLPEKHITHITAGPANLPHFFSLNNKRALTNFTSFVILNKKTQLDSAGTFQLSSIDSDITASRLVTGSSILWPVLVKRVLH